MSDPAPAAPAPFSHGAAWVRADFHLHTIEESGNSRSFRRDYRDDDQEARGHYLRDWFDRLEAENVRVGVITNHNAFHAEDYLWHARQGRKRGILILPGVELNVNLGSGIHTLVVFSPEWVADPTDGDGINRFLARQFPTRPKAGTRSRDGLLDCLQCLEEFGRDYFVVFAHVENDNGLLKELHGDALAENIRQCGALWNRRVLGLQKVKSGSGIPGRWPRDVPVPAAVSGSDPKSMPEVGAGAATYLKIGELTFDSVRFALHDHRERVRREPPVAATGPRLHQISFTGGLLAGQSFDFSRALTTLIGSRGSGKSTVIECLRYALDLGLGEAEGPYKNQLVRAMLANGGEITICGENAEGQPVTITRSLDFPPLVRVRGRATGLLPAAVFPGVLCFGQKDLGHRHENFEAELFARLCGGPSPEDSAREREQLAAVGTALREHEAILRARTSDEELAQEAEAVGLQLALFEEKGVEARLRDLTQFDADKRSLVDFISQLETFRARLAPPAGEWSEVLGAIPALRSTHLQDLAGKIAAAAADLSAVQAGQLRWLREIDVVLRALRLALREVLAKERVLQEQFSALQREIHAPELNLDHYRRLRTRHTQLGKLREAAAKRGATAERLLERAVTAAGALHALYQAWHQQELDRLAEQKATLPPQLELHSEGEGRRCVFESLLREKLQGTGFRSASARKVAERFPNGLALWEGREEIPALVGAADGRRLLEALQAHAAAFLVFRAPDRREIRFEGKPIQELSLGQRATALLMLLMSLENHPILLIDQPEDDLDNETIFRRVVEPLLRRKHCSQFIIATHNPNLPVLGDAELVHSCREEARGRYTHRSGSLESTETRRSIVEIMEGGEQAFAQRQKVYRQWAG